MVAAEAEREGRKWVIALGAGRTKREGIDFQEFRGMEDATLVPRIRETG